MYTHIQFRCTIFPSGFVKVQQNIESIIAHPAWLTISEDIKDPDKRIVMIFGVVFVVMFLLVALGEISEYVMSVYKYGPIRGTMEYFEIWNLIDWLNILMV